MNKKIIINLKIFYLIILFIVSFFLLFIHNYNENENEIFIINNKKSYLKFKLIRKFNDYINICLKNRLIIKDFEIINPPKYL